VGRRANYFPKTGKGSLEAFDAGTGALKWSAPVTPYQLFASHSMVYTLTHKGNPPTEREVIAFDLKTGKEKWRVPHTKFSTEPDLHLNLAGPGYVVIAKAGPQNAGIFVLSAGNGKLLWKLQPVNSIWTPVIDGLLWCETPEGGKKYDPLTGKIKGNMPAPVYFTHAAGTQSKTIFDPLQKHDGLGCSRSIAVGPYICRTRACLYQEVITENGQSKIKPHWYKVGRGACGQGAVPANGMFYTGKSGGCGCYPSQPLGFVAFGPSGPWPTKADFEKARARPTFRHDPERAAAAASKVV
jgi:outer membrane protein assembly factor BamB